MNISIARLIAFSIPWAVLAANCCAETSARPFPSFTRESIDDHFEKGYQVKGVDIDGDGDLDVVALSTAPSQFVWYRNPDWRQFTISTMAERNIDTAPYDVDGDGDLDLALANEFDLGNSTEGGLVHWAECPADPVNAQEWPLHRIDAVPTAHRVRWADLDGDGRAELVNLPIIGVGARAPGYEGGLRFTAYAIPGAPKTEPWPTRVLSETLELAHGLAVVQWDETAAMELLTASHQGLTLFRWTPGSDEAHTIVLGAGHEGIRPRTGSSEVGLGSLGTPGRRYLAAIEPWHGNEVVVYTPGASGDLPWVRRVIDDEFNDGHALACADLDGDGVDEIIAGHRGAPYGLYIYRYNTVNSDFERIALDAGGMGAAGIDVCDLDQDGDLDVLAIGTPTNNVVLYRNTSKK